MMEFLNVNTDTKYLCNQSKNLSAACNCFPLLTQQTSHLCFLLQRLKKQTRNTVSTAVTDEPCTEVPSNLMYNGNRIHLTGVNRSGLGVIQPQSSSGEIREGIAT